MQPPTTPQIRTALEVLNKLGERINSRAEQSVVQLADSQCAALPAGRIEAGAIEQTTRIEVVAAQLNQWLGEMVSQQIE